MTLGSFQSPFVSVVVFFDLRLALYIILVLYMLLRFSVLCHVYNSFVQVLGWVFYYYDCVLVVYYIMFIVSLIVVLGQG